MRILHNSNCQLLDDTQIMTLDNNIQEQSREILDETPLFFPHDYCHNFENSLSEYAYDVKEYAYVVKEYAYYLYIRFRVKKF